MGCAQGTSACAQWCPLAKFIGSFLVAHLPASGPLPTCSIYLKRLVNPSRKADDGWKTVK